MSDAENHLDYLPKNQKDLAKWLNKWGQLIWPSGNVHSPHDELPMNYMEVLDGREEHFTTTLFDGLIRKTNPSGWREIISAFTDDRPFSKREGGYETQSNLLYSVMISFSFAKPENQFLSDAINQVLDGYLSSPINLTKDSSQRDLLFNAIEAKYADSSDILQDFSDELKEKMQDKYPFTNHFLRPLKDRLTFYQKAGHLPALLELDSEQYLRYSNAADALNAAFLDLRLLQDKDKWRTMKEHVTTYERSQTDTFRIINFADYASFLDEVVKQIPEADINANNREQIEKVKATSGEIKKAVQNTQQGLGSSKLTIDYFDTVSREMRDVLRVIEDSLDTGHDARTIIQCEFSHDKHWSKGILQLGDASYANSQIQELDIHRSLSLASNLFPENDPARKILQMALKEFPCKARDKERTIEHDATVQALAGIAREHKQEVWAQSQQ